MKPTNGFFVFVYYVLGFILRFIHPTTVEGLEKLPKSGVLLCPNHSSNWDPVLLGTRLPVNYRLHAMAKEELFKNPILGWILRKLGAFPVSRGNNDIQSVKTAIQVLKSGDNLLIFPEGTVVRNGVGYIDGLPAHAKSGAAMIGVRTGAKLVPVFMDGEKKLFHKTRIIFGPMSRSTPAATAPPRRCRRSLTISCGRPMPWVARPWEESRCEQGKRHVS